MKYTFIAACMMHVEGYYSIKSRAFQNNNPGNIEHDGKYIKYPNKITGYRALVNDIQANAGNTVKEFLTKYAPPVENDTVNYINIVCSLTGMKPEDIL